MSEKEAFWQNFFASTSLTPSLDVKLLGQSGITHQFPAIGTGDDGRDKRMVLVTSEPDPIKARLIGHDIQRKYPSERIILSRANIADTKAIVSRFAMKFLQMQGQGDFKEQLELALSDFSQEKIDSDGFLEASKGTMIEDVVRSIFYGRSVLDTSVFESIVQFVRECILLEVHSMISDGHFDFSALIKRSAYSREAIEGICPIPIFELMPDDWGVLTRESNAFDSLALLKRLGVQQYFEPPIDQIALVLAENSKLSASTLQTTSEALSEIGHKTASPELISSGGGIDELIARLKDQNYVVEGEFEFGITESGRQERALVKFRPREAVFFKLLKEIPGISQLLAALRQ